MVRSSAAPKASKNGRDTTKVVSVLVRLAHGLGIQDTQNRKSALRNGYFRSRPYTCVMGWGRVWVPVTAQLGKNMTGRDEMSLDRGKVLQ